jgi:hypothetical protein
VVQAPRPREEWVTVPVSESGISRVRRSRLLAKCLDCGHEFVGSAEYVVHTVDGQTVREVFNRVVAKCPISDSHRVTLRDA